MKITRFEDLQAWQQARVLANLVYDATELGNFAKDFKLQDQIRGAAGSVMHNCAEGFDAGFDNEFVVFLKYARRSANEIQSEIYLALSSRLKVFINVLLLKPPSSAAGTSPRAYFVKNISTDYLDRKYVDITAFNQIYDKATETKKIINALIAYLRKGKPGRKSS